MKNYLILLILFSSFTIKGYSQNDVSVSLGMGLPELLNAGIRYELSPVEFGVSLGTAFTGAFAVSGDVYYHFAGNSKFSEIPPWYIRANITYWPFGKLLLIDLGEAVLLGFRIGRDFNISQNLGMSIDGGIIPFSFFSGRRIPFSFIPTVSISIYNRLLEMNSGARSRNYD